MCWVVVVAVRVRVFDEPTNNNNNNNNTVAVPAFRKRTRVVPREKVVEDDEDLQTVKEVVFLHVGG